MVEAESMKQMLTPPRFAEFYTEYLRRNAVDQDAGELNRLLRDAGKKYGWQAMAPLLEKYPGGFERWDSMIHGWAMKSPREATDWFNSLPETLPRHNRALNGLVWGLTERDGQFAGEVMSALSDKDRDAAVHSFANAFVANHGLAALDSWCAEAEPELAKKTIQNAVYFASQQDPSATVKWFVKHVDELGIRHELLKAFDQWLQVAPTEADAWLATLPQQDDGGADLREQLGRERRTQ